MSETYFDVQVPATTATRELAGLLDQDHLLGVWEEEGTIHLYWAQNHWSPSFLDEIFCGISRLESPGLNEKVIVKEIPWMDWNATWAASIDPIRIGKRILIQPSWKAQICPPDIVQLTIDPKQAFGTGHHPTTQLLLEALEDLIQGGETILDIGTGSGILAMAALRLGGACALGIDNDSLALQCAKEYAMENGFGPELDLQQDIPENIPSKPYDIILANLDRRTLIKTHRSFRYWSSAGTRLLLSGILEEHQPEIMEVFRRDGWRVRNITRKEEWRAIILEWPLNLATPACAQDIQSAPYR